MSKSGIGRAVLGVATMGLSEGGGLRPLGEAALKPPTMPGQDPNAPTIPNPSDDPATAAKMQDQYLRQASLRGRSSTMLSGFGNSMSSGSGTARTLLGV